MQGIILSLLPPFQARGKSLLERHRRNNYNWPERASILVEWTAKGTQSTSVIQENNCGKTNAIYKLMQVTGQPSQIQGDAQTGLGIHTYEVTLQNELNFRWEISGGGIVQQGQGTSRVLISWQSEGDFQLKVTPQNECNDGIARVLEVNVNVITSLSEKEISGEKVFPNPSSGVIFVEFKNSSH